MTKMPADYDFYAAPYSAEVERLKKRIDELKDACLNAAGYIRGGSILTESQVLSRLREVVKIDMVLGGPQ